MATTKTNGKANGTAKSAPKRKVPAASAKHSPREQLVLAGLGLYSWSKEHGSDFYEELIKRGEKEEKQLEKRWKETRKEWEGRFDELREDIRQRLGMDKPEAEAAVQQ